MKSSLFTVLASVASFVVAFPASDPPAAYGGAAADKRPQGWKVEELKPQFSSEYKRVRVTYGRYHLKPYNETTMSMGGGMDMGGKGMGGGMDMGVKGMGGSMDMSKGKGGMGGAMDMGKGGGMAGGMAGMGKQTEEKDPGGMENEGGLTDASYKNAPKPCSDCTIKYAKSYLTYPDGSVANIDSGAWVHHLTMSVTGPGREDLRCPGGTQRIPIGMERMLAFHNDRNETYYGVDALDKRGFYLGKDDSIILELMLKNELSIPKEVEYSIEYEFLPGDKRKDGWGDVRGIWMDVAPCSAAMSDLPIPKGKTQFTVSGDAWTSSINGRLLNTVGHMHDGGLLVEIKQNDKPVCSSKAVYEGVDGYIPSKEAIAKGAADMTHINYYTPCIDIGEIKKGDILTISANYDFDKHKPLTNKIGADSDVMGLALLFVEVQK